MAILTKFLIDEISAVSRPAQEGALAVIRKSDDGAPKRPSQLTKIEVDEVSLVDRGANRDAWITLYKRDDSADDDEEAKRRRKPLDDDEEAAALRRRNPINHVAPPDPDEVLAEKMLDYAKRGLISKSEFEIAIGERAAKIQKAGESSAQAYVRAMTADVLGRELFKASRLAPVFPTAFDSVQDLVPRRPQPVPEPERTSLEVRALSDSRYAEATRFRRGVNDPKELHRRLEAATRELRREQQAKRGAMFG
jgi:hypothetical protein